MTSRQVSLDRASTGRRARGLMETVDIPARIAELRSVLVETRSADVREAIQAAIEDCRRQLAELEGELPRSGSNQQPSG